MGSTFDPLMEVDKPVEHPERHSLKISSRKSGTPIDQRLGTSRKQIGNDKRAFVDFSNGVYPDPVFTRSLLLYPGLLKKCLDNEPLFASGCDRIEILDMDEERFTLATRTARSSSEPQRAP